MRSAALSCQRLLTRAATTKPAATFKGNLILSASPGGSPCTSIMTRRMGSWPKVRPVRIRVITMDVTGTIVSFRGSLEEHYLGAAEKCGVDKDKLYHLGKKEIHKAFGDAYYECCELYPCFGGDELPAKEWWKRCVGRSFEIAGVSMDHIQQEQVFQRIYSTFGSHAAYESFPDAKPFLGWLKRHQVVTGILSNADERYGDSILPMLGITMDEVQFTCFSKDFKMEKPDPRFFRAAVETAAPSILSTKGRKEYQDQKYYNRDGTLNADKICHPSEVLHIGNDFVKDFEGARNAGMHCVLLDRYGEEEKAAEWRRRGAPVLKDLLDVVEFLGRSNCRLG